MDMDLGILVIRFWERWIILWRTGLGFLLWCILLVWFSLERLLEGTLIWMFCLLLWMFLSRRVRMRTGMMSILLQGLLQQKLELQQPPTTLHQTPKFHHYPLQVRRIILLL